ncbi:MAG: hypothetical protein Q8O52_23545 [Sulfuritalea sp.]|nr:hypothetical protein [Sulfuritalea sp.]
MRILSIAFAGFIAAAGSFGLASFSVSAADAKAQTVEALYQNKAALAGKTISVQGKVMKVNNGIMNRNWLHLQDGTGDAKTRTNDLVIASQQSASVGDQVTVSGVVAVNKDFGAGYNYPLLIEDASIAPKK